MHNPSPPPIKTSLRELAEQLPDNATWDDVMKTIRFRQAVEKGIEAADMGCLTPHKTIKAQWEAKRAARLD